MGIQFCSNEGPHPSPRADNSKIVYLFSKYLKSSSISRATGPISTKLDTMHSWVKGIQDCSNEGPHPFLRGDNHEIVKNTLTKLNIFFSRTTEPISTKLGTKHPWVKGIQVCSNEGPISMGK